MEAGSEHLTNYETIFSNMNVSWILLNLQKGFHSNTWDALAHEMGFKVLEVNASATCNGRQVLANLGGTSQIHNVRGYLMLRPQHDDRVFSYKLKFHFLCSPSACCQVELLKTQICVVLVIRALLVTFFLFLLFGSFSLVPWGSLRFLGVPWGILGIY